MRATLKPPLRTMIGASAAGLRWAGLGWAGLGVHWAGLRWAGLGWVAQGRAGLGWSGLGLSRRCRLLLVDGRQRLALAKLGGLRQYAVRACMRLCSSVAMLSPR